MPARRTKRPDTLRVAIVGAGPAACYAANELLGIRNVEIGDRITHGDLLAHHHAVVYAVGASASRHRGEHHRHPRGDHRQRQRGPRHRTDSAAGH
jgi:ferredoxin/flavodoxin---NADP+ reductase